MDLSKSVEKKTKRGNAYYEDETGVIVAKQCTKCSEVKELTDFNKSKGKFAGVQAHCKDCKAQYKKENKERIVEYNKKWHEDNREYSLARSKKWREKNREYEYGRIKKWREENIERCRELVRLGGQRRRARKRYLPDTLTDSQDKQLKELQKGKCLLSNSTGKAHLEHFIPLSWGHGGTTFENCYYMEVSLNLSKGDRNPFEWIETQPQDVQKRFHSLLVPMMAERNKMSVKEFKDYVNYCFENPKSIEELMKDAV